MATNIKFTKFDNRPWGFRLAGGSDFPEPLTVIRVSEGSLAECMGLKVGDVIVRLNDQAISTLSHGQAHEALNLAGNNFVLAVHRVEDTDTLVEALSKDNIEPYSIHLNDLPPLQPLEEILSKLTSEPVAEESTEKEIIEESFEEKVEIIERVAQKPKDENSEDIPNENLTDEEIAQLIIVEEELLPEKGVLGVNFKKLRPRASLFKDSKVFEELQKEAIAEPPLVQELKRRTTFLQKPERPIPQPKLVEAEENSETQAQETYKVVIKKQIKKTITDRLVEKGLLEPGCVKSSEQGSEVKMFVPRWAAEIDPQQISPQLINFINPSETTNLVNSSGTINFVNSTGTLNSDNFSEPSIFVNSFETLESRNFPEQKPAPTPAVSAESELDLESSNFSRLINSTSASSSLDMDNLDLTLRPKRLYMRNRYFENCVLRKNCTNEKKKGVGNLRLYRKGQYVSKIVSSLAQSRSSRKTKIQSYKLAIRGHYIEKYLGRKSAWAIVKAKYGIQSLFSSRKFFPKNIQRRGQYVKRILNYYVNSAKTTFDSFCVSGASNPFPCTSGFISLFSNEIFHRGCKRLWSKYRSEKGWFDWVKNFCGISLKVTKKVHEDREMVCKDKSPDLNSLNDNRRLSFVQTVLYDGLTNRIGVDFTRVVVYAFIPCASMVLLYVYK